MRIGFVALCPLSSPLHRATGEERRLEEEVEGDAEHHLARHVRRRADGCREKDKKNGVDAVVREPLRRHDPEGEEDKQDERQLKQEAGAEQKAREERQVLPESPEVLDPVGGGKREKKIQHGRTQCRR